MIGRVRTPHGRVRKKVSLAREFPNSNLGLVVRGFILRLRDLGGGADNLRRAFCLGGRS